MSRIIAAVLGLGLAGSVLAAPQAQAQSAITIATGGVTGVYYPTGGAICSLVNKARKEHGFACTFESTADSLYNLMAIRDGRFDLGVVKSDAQYQAYFGGHDFSDQGPFKELRSVFSLYAEPLTILARADSGIRHFEDLKGKRVNLGKHGTGQRGTMEAAIQAVGWTMGDLALASEFKPTEQVSALCANKIDAMVFTVGHPSGSITEAISSCQSVLVPVMGSAIDKLVSDNSYYRKARIPAGTYRGNDQDILTFGFGATLVTSAAVEEEVIYTVVKAVFENFEAFKTLHPAFGMLREADMIREGLSAPLHDGAVRYYRERGWM